MTIRTNLYSILGLTLMAMLSPPLHAQEIHACGAVTNAYGPYDFRSDKDKLPIVEGAHFLPYVEALTRGSTATTPGGDIDYTLRAFPNHPRALMAMSRLGEKEKTERPAGTRFSVACYFDRAIRFRENDGTVRMIYAIYLMKKNRQKEALQQMEAAAALGEDSPNFHYNMGLVFFDLKQYDKALTHAHKAYQGGFSLPGLREKLRRQGKWTEPPPVTTEEVPAAAPVSPALDVKTPPAPPPVAPANAAPTP